MADVPTPGSAPLLRRISYDPYTAKPLSDDIQGGRLMGMPSVWQRRRSRKIGRERLQVFIRLELSLTITTRPHNVCNSHRLVLQARSCSLGKCNLFFYFPVGSEFRAA